MVNERTRFDLNQLPEELEIPLAHNIHDYRSLSTMRRSIYGLSARARRLHCALRGGPRPFSAADRLLPSR